jgi:hypothetical protein
MGEAHAPVAHGHHVGLLGFVEAAAAAARHGLHQPDGRLRERRRGGERAARLGGQRLEARTHERVQCDRQPLARLEPDRAGAERPRQLQREERIAARQLVQPSKRRPRRKEAEPLLDQVLHRAQAERKQRKPFDALGGGRAIQPEWDRRPGRGPPGHEQPHGAFLEAPHGKRHNQGRGGIEPLDVVDGDHQWADLGERSERREHPEGDALLVRRAIALVVQPERHLDRVPLARSELLHSVEVVSQQVAEGRVREGRLRLGGASREGPAAGVLRAGQRRLPDRRLTGSGLALDHECPGAVPGGFEEELHSLELLLSSHELCAHHSSWLRLPQSCTLNSPLRTPAMASRAGW